MNDFRKRLAYIRKEKGYTQKMPAESIGVSQRVITYHERESNRPPAAKLASIAKILEVSVDELLNLKGIPRNKGISQNAYLRRKIKTVEHFKKKIRILLLI